MGQLRTANKRHKRAIFALQRGKKSVEAKPVANKKPAKEAH